MAALWSRDFESQTSFGNHGFTDGRYSPCVIYDVVSITQVYGLQLTKR